MDLCLRQVGVKPASRKGETELPEKSCHIFGKFERLASAEAKFATVWYFASPLDRVQVQDLFASSRGIGLYWVAGFVRKHSGATGDHLFPAFALAKPGQSVSSRYPSS